MRRVKLVFFFTCKMVGLFRVACWLTRGQLKILCYHGFELADETGFRPKLFITPGQFDQRLATIKRYGLDVVPLDDAVERLYAGRLAKNSVVITIDDGFHSVHRVAVPRLERHGFPATVYVTSYYVEKPNPIFRLAVQYMFWKTAKRELVLDNVPWSSRRVVDLADPTAAERAMWECIDHGERGGGEDRRHAICDDLGERLGIPHEDIVTSRIFHLMTPDELRSLAGANIDIELHTHRHNFPSGDRARAEAEINDNRAALKRWGFGGRHHFCYPSGLWTEEQWTWLDAMDIKSSTTCVAGLNSPQTPRHALRRFLDGSNIHQLEFEAAVSGFSDLVRELGRRAG